MAEAKPRRALADVVADQLRELLASGAWGADQQLPGEAALAQRFSVSRPVVRQALERLRDDGQVYTRKGAGSFVRQPRPDASFAFETLQSVPDIQGFLAFRMSLEGEMAAVAAEQRDAPQFTAVLAADAALRAAIANGAQGIDEDRDFHLAIARATGNRFFISAMEAISAMMVFSIGLTRQLTSRPLAERNAVLLAEHRAIAAAIGDGEPARARQAMIDHLQGGLRRLFGQ